MAGSEVFVGCYSESANQVSTTASPVTQSQQMHVTGCRQICLNAEIQYAMVRATVNLGETDIFVFRIVL